MGFPIFDRHHHHRCPLWGYQGAMNVLVTILDKIFDEMDRNTNVAAKSDYSYDIIRAKIPDALRWPRSKAGHEARNISPQPQET